MLASGPATAVAAVTPSATTVTVNTPPDPPSNLEIAHPGAACGTQTAPTPIRSTRPVFRMTLTDPDPGSSIRAPAYAGRLDPGGITTVGNTSTATVPSGSQVTFAMLDSTFEVGQTYEVHAVAEVQGNSFPDRSAPSPLLVHGCRQRRAGHRDQHLAGIGGGAAGRHGSVHGHRDRAERLRG